MKVLSSVLPVSYTHLDVYKRQALHRAWFLLEAALGDRARERRWAFQASREELTAQTRERARYLVDVLQQLSLIHI